MEKTDEHKEIEYLKSLTYTDINNMFKKLRARIHELESTISVNIDVGSVSHPIDCAAIKKTSKEDINKTQGYEYEKWKGTQ